MAVNLAQPQNLRGVPGVWLSTAAAAINAEGRDDIALILLEAGSAVAAVFTRSSFRAPPVEIAERHIADGAVRALLINSGNANAATGKQGNEDALALCSALARDLNLETENVAPFSTGVIGERLPVDRMLEAFGDLSEKLSEDGWLDAARAIMTTDTVPKAVSRTVSIGGADITITGMTKGSGMIRPDMATMLAYICCDARISGDCLRSLAKETADASFNRITIDGDTSTNDAFVLCATCLADHPLIDDVTSSEYAAIFEAVSSTAADLAQSIVRDGEGATKFVTVLVAGGASQQECLDVAYTIAHSPLVKTAIFAGDPNWGRLSMAIGRAGVSALDVSGVNAYFDDVCVMSGGLKHPEYSEAKGAAVMAQDEFTIRIELGRGHEVARIWTSDLSYEYVRINAEYRT